MAPCARIRMLLSPAPGLSRSWADTAIWTHCSFRTEELLPDSPRSSKRIVCVTATRGVYQLRRRSWSSPRLSLRSTGGKLGVPLGPWIGKFGYSRALDATRQPARLLRLALETKELVWLPASDIVRNGKAHYST